MAARWEYKIVTTTPDSDGDDEEVLNELGDEGWELVCVHVSEVTYVESSGEDEDSEDGGEGEGDEYVEEVATYYLKREKGGSGA